MVGSIKNWHPSQKRPNEIIQGTPGGWKLMILLEPSPNKRHVSIVEQLKWVSESLWKLLKCLCRLKLQMLIKTVCPGKQQRQQWQTERSLPDEIFPLGGSVPCYFPDFLSSSEVGVSAGELTLHESWNLQLTIHCAKHFLMFFWQLERADTYLSWPPSAEVGSQVCSATETKYFWYCLSKWSFLSDFTLYILPKSVALH